MINVVAFDKPLFLERRWRVEEPRPLVSRCAIRRQHVQVVIRGLQKKNKIFEEKKNFFCVFFFYFWESIRKKLKTKFFQLITNLLITLLQTNIKIDITDPIECENSHRAPLNWVLLAQQKETESRYTKHNTSFNLK